MRFRRVRTTTTTQLPAGAVFRLHRLAARLYVFEVARKLRMSCRVVHDFEDGLLDLEDPSDLARMYAALGRTPPGPDDPLPLPKKKPIPFGYPDIRRRKRG